MEKMGYLRYDLKIYQMSWKLNAPIPATSSISYIV